LRVELAKDFDQWVDQPGPSSLMTGADAGTVVAEEIVVEQQMIEFLGAAKHRPAAGLVAQKNAGRGDWLSRV
jgi:hypothetical protein